MDPEPHALVAQPAEPDLETANTDCAIFKLPAELLDRIFELAYHCPGPDELPYDPYYPAQFIRRQPAHRPICRAVCGIQQRHLYRHIHVASLSKLPLLVGTLVEDKVEPHLGSFVVSLTLGSKSAGSWTTVGHRELEQTSLLAQGRSYNLIPVGAAPRLLADLLGTLTRLTSLGVFIEGNEDENDDGLAMLRVMFQHPSALAHLSSIKEVYLESSSAALAAAFPDDAGAWLAQLGRLRHLETLNLGFNEHGLPTVLYTTSAARPVLEELRRLKLCGSFDAWRVRLCDLAPKQASLEVESSRAWSERTALRAVVEHAPPTVVELAISVSDDDDPEDVPKASEAIDDLLPNLPLLRTVFLAFSCYDPIRLASSLARLAHLEDLHFGRGAVLPDPTLLGLVEGPYRLRSLRKLTLDYVVEAIYGPTMSDKGGRPPRANECDAAGLWWGWRAPVWPEGCSEVGVARAVRDARAQGVAVAGSAVEAIGWLGAYVAERDAVARCRAGATGA